MTKTDFDRATDALAARLEALLKDNYALTRSLDAERDEIARLTAVMARSEGENSLLREALESVRAISEGLAALAGRVDGLTDRVSESAGALRHVHSDVIAAADGHRNVAAEQLHAILTSRSWRMTRPVRALGRVFKRLRG